MTSSVCVQCGTRSVGDTAQSLPWRQFSLWRVIAVWSGGPHLVCGLGRTPLPQEKKFWNWPDEWEERQMEKMGGGGKEGRTSRKREDHVWNHPLPKDPKANFLGVLKMSDFKCKWKTGFPVTPPPTLSRPLPYSVRWQAAENTPLQFSGILLPLPPELQATGFLELQTLFELQLKLEMCFESHYASIFIPSVYEPYRCTLWFIIHRAY